MKLKELAKGIAGVAPTIATALGGPLAGAAVGALSRALLGHERGTIDDLLPTLTSLTPEQSAALYAADRELRAELARLDVRRDELVIEDRTGARGRDVAYVQGGRRNTRGDVLAYSAVGLLALCILLLFFTGQDLTPVVQNLLSSLIGGLVVIVKDVFGFEFGSSRGSERKTEMMVGK